MIPTLLLLRRGDAIIRLLWTIWTPKISVVPGRRGEGGGCAAAEVVVETKIPKKTKPKTQKPKTTNHKPKPKNCQKQKNNTEKNNESRECACFGIPREGGGKAGFSLAVVLSLLILFRLPFAKFVGKVPFVWLRFTTFVSTFLSPFLSRPPTD